MSAAKGTPASSAFFGGGEMGKLIREKDWSQTPLGPIDTWPPSLLTTVSLVLSTITSTIDFKELFEKSPGMFLVLRTDPAFTIVAATHDYLQATLTRREDIIGRPLFDVFPDNPDDLQATGTSNLRDSLQRCLANKVADTMAVQKYDIPRPASEGGGFEERYWSPVNQPVVTDDGNVEYIIHRVEDVTEFVRVRQSSALEHERSEALVLHTDVMEAEILRRSEELNSANKALRKANKQLAEFDQAKTAFFSNISHEFRTPLTLMLGPLEDELAEAAALPAPRRERLELAQRNALRLLKLVNTLLDFSRIEAGRAQAQYQATDLAALTTDLAGQFRSAVERAGLTFSVDCPPLPEPLFVDHEMWEKIVLNLLSNALKHTFSGGIRMALHGIGDAVELEVADTGVGIPAAELPHLFERFHRVAGARSRAHEGSGIGLALVQGLAHLHAGSVRVASTEGQGSTFTVSLPRGRNHLPQDQISAATPVAASTAAAYIEEARHWTDDTPAAPASVADASSPRPRILWADDNADMRNYVSRLLSADYTVTAVDNGVAAVASALAQPPDLVLTDIMMPGLDGIGVLRALRADERTRLVPVILLSARAGVEESESGLAEGADDYLVKPFAARELLARVRTHLNLGQLRRESLRAQNLQSQARFKEDEIQAQLAVAAESRRVLLNLLEDQQQAEAKLLAALKEKTALLNEVHHRVKNNLQVITSLLRLESFRSTDAPTKSVLLDMQGRVRAMALLHETIYRKGTFAAIDLGSYVGQIAGESLKSMQINSGAVRLQLDVEALQVGLDQATPAGLLISELVSNSLKHAFPEGRTGTINIALHPLDTPGQWRLRVSDSGIGFAADFEARRKTSLGLQLAGDMAKQMGGALHVGAGPQAVFTVDFKAQVPAPLVITLGGAKHP